MNHESCCLPHGALWGCNTLFCSSMHEIELITLSLFLFSRDWINNYNNEVHFFMFLIFLVVSLFFVFIVIISERSASSFVFLFLYWHGSHLVTDVDVANIRLFISLSDSPLNSHFSARSCLCVFRRTSSPTVSLLGDPFHLHRTSPLDATLFLCSTSFLLSVWNNPNSTRKFSSWVGIGPIQPIWTFGLVQKNLSTQLDPNHVHL